MIETREWPKHTNGRNKKFGELTPEERRYFTKEAVTKLKREFSDPEFQKRVGEVLKGDDK